MCKTLDGLFFCTRNGHLHTIQLLVFYTYFEYVTTGRSWIIVPYRPIYLALISLQLYCIPSMANIDFLSKQTLAQYTPVQLFLFITNAQTLVFFLVNKYDFGYVELYVIIGLSFRHYLSCLFILFNSLIREPMLTIWWKIRGEIPNTFYNTWQLTDDILVSIYLLQWFSVLGIFNIIL